MNRLRFRSWTLNSEKSTSYWISRGIWFWKQSILLSRPLCHSSTLDTRTELNRMKLLIINIYKCIETIPYSIKITLHRGMSFWISKVRKNFFTVVTIFNLLFKIVVGIQCNKQFIDALAIRDWCIWDRLNDLPFRNRNFCPVSKLQIFLQNDDLKRLKNLESADIIFNML